MKKKREDAPEHKPSCLLALLWLTASLGGGVVSVPAVSALDSIGEQRVQEVTALEDTALESELEEAKTVEARGDAAAAILGAGSILVVLSGLGEARKSMHR